MNQAQETALALHCRFAFETMNPRLIRASPWGSTILSVNSGYE
jgi:hypothetical protein